MLWDALLLDIVLKMFILKLWTVFWLLKFLITHSLDAFRLECDNLFVIIEFFILP